MELGKIEKVDLRDIWNHEASDFTDWVAENLEQLGEAIGVGLSIIETESKVGQFKVDIYAEQTDSDRKVIIENQLEQTNHDHLGKLITYASGLDAKVIIWIVKDVREEHQKAIDWLNEHTDDEISLFAIKIEAWKIGDSKPAPKFEVVSKPNNWSKAVKESQKTKELSETKQKQLQFWQQFREHAPKELTGRKEGAQHWYNVAIGRSDCYIGLTIESRKKELACEIYVRDNEETYQEFYRRKNEIEQGIGETLEWMPLSDKIASRIKLKRNADFTDESKWDEYFKWLQDKALLFKRVFKKVNDR